MIRWIDCDDSLVPYTVKVTTPHGDVLDEPIVARDEEDALTQAAERLAADYADAGMTYDDALQYVGPAEKLPKYA